MYKGLFCFLFTLLFYVNAKTQVTESDTISISDFVQEMVGFDTLKATPVPPGNPTVKGSQIKKYGSLIPKKTCFIGMSWTQIKRLSMIV